MHDRIELYLECLHSGDGCNVIYGAGDGQALQAGNISWDLNVEYLPRSVPQHIAREGPSVLDDVGYTAGVALLHQRHAGFEGAFAGHQ